MAKFIADIDGIERKLQSKREITVLDKLHVYQWLNRDVRRHLTPSQFVAYSYIIDRTVGCAIRATCYNPKTARALPATSEAMTSRPTWCACRW